LMSATNMVLPSGLGITTECLTPPVDPAQAAEISKVIFEHLREDRLEEILLGKHSADAEFRIMAARGEGELAGTCWFGWGRRFAGIAVLGGVVTRGPWRGKGIARQLVSQACRTFDEAGGRLLFLATTNPSARRLYEDLGFRRFTGHVMCRCAAGAAPLEGFAPGQPARARAASWRDMAVVAPLYLLEHPCVLVDSGTLLPSSRLSPAWRCVRIFWDIWGSVAGKGRWMVLENESGWLVASAVARPAEGVGPQFTIDFARHPDYSSEAATMIGALVRDVEAESGRPCEMLIAREDDWKRAEAARLGFDRVKESGIFFELEGRRQPLVRLLHGLPGSSMS
jgi:GNAT superfamily N-acetyltransferase